MILRPTSDDAGRSTGPKTDEGKRRSSANARKHGFSGDAIRFAKEKPEMFDRRLEDWRDAFDISNSYEDWLFQSYVAESIRVEECEVAIACILKDLGERAGEIWVSDQRAIARELDDKLARKPKLYAGKLTDMKYGCELLIEHWEGLTRVLNAKGDWNDAQKNLALDLVGADVEHREGYALFRIGAPDEAGKLLTERRSFAAARIVELRERMEGLVDFIDDVRQDYAKAGIRLDDPKAIANFKRYERECRRRMERYRKELLERSAARSAATPPRVESPKPTEVESPRPTEPEPRFVEVLEAVEENDRLIAAATIPELTPSDDSVEVDVEFEAWVDRAFGVLENPTKSSAKGAAAVAAPRRKSPKKRKRR